MKKYFRVFITAVLILSVFASCNAELNTDKVYGGKTCEVVLTLKDGSHVTKTIQGTEVPANFLSNYFLQGKADVSVDDIVEVTFNRVTKVVGTSGDQPESGNASFRDCKKLTKITFDSAIQHIGAYAFNSAADLQQVNLANVRTIGDRAFYNANTKSSPYTNIVINTEEPPVLGKSVFGDDNQLKSTNVSIVVEKDGKYRTADVWKDMFDENIINPDAVAIYFVIPKEEREGSITLNYDVTPTDLNVRLSVGEQLIDLPNEISSEDKEKNGLNGYNFIGWAYSPSDLYLINAENAAKEENLAGFGNKKEKTVYAILEPRTIEVKVTGLSSAIGDYVMKVKYLGGIDEVTAEEGGTLMKPEDKEMKLVGLDQAVKVHLKGIYTTTATDLERKLIMSYDTGNEEWLFVTGSDLFVVLDDNSEPIWVYGKDCTVQSVWDAEYEMKFKFNLLSEDAYFVTASDLCCGYPTVWSYEGNDEAINPVSEKDEKGNVVYTGSFTLGQGWSSLPTSTDLIKRDYYKFAGWYKTHINQDGKDYFDVSATTISPADSYNGQLEFYAKWDPVTVKIEYYDGVKEIKASSSDKFDAKFAEAPKTVYNVYERITETVSTLPVPEKVGYVFAGWTDGTASNTDLADKDGKLITDVSGYTTDERWVVSGSDLTRTIKVYAKWTPITYTFNFKLKGGVLASGTDLTKVTDDSYTKTYTFDLNAISITVKENSPAKDGFSFKGWFLEETPTDLSKKVAEISKEESHLNLAEATTTTTDLYAVWGAREYRIEYYDILASETDLATSTDFPGTTFTGKFYTGSGDSLEVIIPGDPGRPIVHNFGFETNVNNPAKTGYKFEKWTICVKRGENLYEYFPVSEGKIAKDVDFGETDKLYLCATWTPITYTVYLHLNGDGADVSTGTDLILTSETDDEYGKQYSFKYTYDTTSTDLPKVSSSDLKEVFLKGNTFLGWYQSRNAVISGTIDSDGKFNPTGNIERIAGNSVNLADDNHVIDLYARWQKNTYNVALNMNDGGDLTTKFNLKTMTFTYGDNIPSGKKLYEEANPTRTGYTFGGWYFASETDLLTNGEGLLVSGSDIIINPTFVEDSDGKKWCYSADNLNVELKAKWTLTPYTVTVVLDKGKLNSTIVASGTDLTKWAVDGDKATKQRTYSTSTDLDLPERTEISRPGYSFMGWYVSPTDVTKTYVTSVDGTTLEDKTFYADWVAGTFKILMNDSYSYYESDDDIPSLEVTYEKPVTIKMEGSDDEFNGMLPRPERAGYKFLGWSLDANVNNLASTATDLKQFTDNEGEIKFQDSELKKIYFDDSDNWIFKDEQNVTVYARWKEIGIPVYVNNVLTASDISYSEGIKPSELEEWAGTAAFAVIGDDSDTRVFAYDGSKWYENGMEIADEKIFGLPLQKIGGDYRLSIQTASSVKVLFFYDKSELEEAMEAMEDTPITSEGNSSTYPQFEGMYWNLPYYDIFGGYYHEGFMNYDIENHRDGVLVDSSTIFEPNATVGTGTDLLYIKSDVDGSGGNGADTIVLYGIWDEIGDDYEYEGGGYDYSYTNGTVRLWYLKSFNPNDSKYVGDLSYGYRKESLSTSEKYKTYPTEPANPIKGYTFTGYTLHRIGRNKSTGLVVVNSANLSMVIAEDFYLKPYVAKLAYPMATLVESGDHIGEYKLEAGTKVSIAPAGAKIYVTQAIGSSCVFVDNWTPNTYTIVLDTGLTDAIRAQVMNDGVAVVTPTELTATYGKDLILPLNTYTRTGYLFDHWMLTEVPSGTDQSDVYDEIGTLTYTNLDGRSINKTQLETKVNKYQYSDGETIKFSRNTDKYQNFANTYGATVKLTAVWQEADLSVSFAVNGGNALTNLDKSLFKGNTKTVTMDKPYGKLPSETNITNDNHYLFEGWYLPVTVSGDDLNVDGTVMDSGKVTLVVNDVPTEVLPVKLVGINGVQLTDTPYGVKVDENTKVSTPTSHTLIAQWKTIDFMKNKKDIAETRFVTKGSAYGTLPTPSDLPTPTDLTVIKFAGWYKMIEETDPEKVPADAVALYDYDGKNWNKITPPGSSIQKYGVPVTASTKIASAGEHVVIYPQWGYEVTTVMNLATTTDIVKTVVPYNASAKPATPPVSYTNASVLVGWYKVTGVGTPSDLEVKLFNYDGTSSGKYGVELKNNKLDNVTTPTDIVAQWGSKLTLQKADDSQEVATYRYGQALPLSEGYTFKIGGEGAEYTVCDRAMGKAATLKAVEKETD